MAWQLGLIWTRKPCESIIDDQILRGLEDAAQLLASAAAAPAWVLLASVMSRATFGMPMIAPEGDLIGEMLSETSIRLAVLAQAYRFVVLDALTPADPSQRVLDLRQPVGGNEQRDVLARGFRGRSIRIAARRPNSSR